MKKLLIISVFITLVFVAGYSQGIKDIFNKVKKDSSGKGIIEKAEKNIPGGNAGSLTNEDIINGLKEALRVGTDSSSKRLSNADGYFGDAAVKILMPSEARNVEQTLRNLGMGNLVDKTILSMN